jgi:putative ABC transport system permease protein
MLRAMLRDLRAHKGRIAMTLVAIVLGVSFVVATWVVSDSTAATMAGADARTDVGVAVQIKDRAPELTTADRDRLAALPGVGHVTAMVAGHAGLVGTNGKLVSGRPDTAGTTWDDTQRFELADGKAPAPGEVALGERQAREAGWKVGDTARVLLGNGTQENAVVAGIFTYRSLGEPEPAVAFGTPGILGDRFTRIELTGPDPGAIAAAVRARTDPALREVSTGADLAAEVQAQAESSAQSARDSLLAFAAVALLVGMFVIANTFAMLVTQRTRQLALLRAVGASRRQVRRAVLVEAGVLGWIGATLGAGLGIGLGLLAMSVTRPEGTAVTFSVSPTAILAGYAVGVPVTVLAAYASARRAAAVSPMAALRTDAVIPRRSLLIRSIAGGVALLIAAIVTIATLSNDLSTGERVVGIGAGLLGWLGVLLLAPALAGVVLTPLGRLLSRRGGPAARLGMRNAVRDPRRTAATTSALMVGLALVCAFATVGETMVSMLSTSVRATVPEGAVVLQSPTKNVPLATDVLAKVRAVPGVKASADRYGYVKVNGHTTTMSAIEPDGLLTPDVRGGAVVGRNEAAMLGIKAGDQVGIEIDPVTTIQVTVASLYDGTEAQPLFYVDVARISEHYRATRVTTVYALGPRAAIEAAFRDRPDVVVTDRDGLIEDATSRFRLLLSVMYALFGAAIVIAAFGVVNTLALSVMERTREIGVLRAVGASRGLIRRSVRLESVVICGYGGLLGIVVGVGFGAVMQHAMLGQDLWRISVPYLVIGIALVGMVIAGVLAAMWPARRAARTDVLTAIAT